MAIRSYWSFNSLGLMTQFRFPASLATHMDFPMDVKFNCSSSQLPSHGQSLHTKVRVRHSIALRSTSTKWLLHMDPYMSLFPVSTAWTTCIYSAVKNGHKEGLNITSIHALLPIMPVRPNFKIRNVHFIWLD